VYIYKQYIYAKGQFNLAWYIKENRTYTKIFSKIMIYGRTITIVMIVYSIQLHVYMNSIQLHVRVYI